MSIQSIEEAIRVIGNTTDEIITKARYNTFQIRAIGIASANCLEPCGRTSTSTKSAKRSSGRNGSGGGSARFLGLYLWYTCFSSRRFICEPRWGNQLSRIVTLSRLEASPYTSG